MTLKLKQKKITSLGYSFFLCLPKVWIDYHDLQKGDPIDVEISDDSEGRVLILRPMKGAKNE